MPDNAGYMHAAYLIAGFIYFTYGLTLYFRARQALAGRRDG